jgi:hypothetical protein
MLARAAHIVEMAAETVALQMLHYIQEAAGLVDMPVMADQRLSHQDRQERAPQVLVVAAEVVVRIICLEAVG